MCQVIKVQTRCRLYPGLWEKEGFAGKKYRDSIVVVNSEIDAIGLRCHFDVVFSML